MKVIGLDPGSLKTGWGIVEKTDRGLTLVEAGVIAPPRGEELPRRLVSIHEQLSQLLRRHRPDAACVEKIFHAANSHSLTQLAQARGVALLAAAQCAIPICEYSPNEVKQAVVGYGKAAKEQVQTMVRHLLPGFASPGFDASDALALALCHLQGRSVADKIQQLTAAPAEGR